MSTDSDSQESDEEFESTDKIKMLNLNARGKKITVPLKLAAKFPRFSDLEIEDDSEIYINISPLFLKIMFEFVRDEYKIGKLKEQLCEEFDKDNIIKLIANLGMDAYVMGLFEKPRPTTIKIPVYSTDKSDGICDDKQNTEKKYEKRIIIMGCVLTKHDMDSGMLPVLISSDRKCIASSCHEINKTVHYVEAQPMIIDDDIKFYEVQKEVDNKYIIRVKKEHIIEDYDRYFMKMEDYIQYEFPNVSLIKEFFSNPLYSKS